jgi:type I restriction enzyme M protein
VFNRGKKDNTNILFVDASKGFDTGKNQNILRPQDIEKIIETHNNFQK